MAITGEGIDVAYPQTILDPKALRAAVSGGYAWAKVYDPDPDRPIKLDQPRILRSGGFKVGGYGFMRNVPPEEQAAGFLAALARTDANDIVAMVDLEPTSIGKWGFTNNQAGADAASAVGRHVCQVLAWNGITPIVYSFQSFMQMMRLGTWGFPVLKAIANYTSKPSMAHDVHQYTSTATLPGLLLGNRIDRCRSTIDLTARKEPPMATWHVAGALEQLRKQLNAMAPNRSTVSDGGIGDAAHASRSSDHNPWYNNTVTARDFTHDPAGGLDCHWLANRLIASGDSRIKYIIWDNRIWQGSWKPYYGSNPHTKHLHLSVQPNPSCESAAPWNLGTTGGGSTPPAPPTTNTDLLLLEDNMREVTAKGLNNVQRVTIGLPGIPGIDVTVNRAYEGFRVHSVKGIGRPGPDGIAWKGTTNGAQDCAPARPFAFPVEDGAVFAEVEVSGDVSDNPIVVSFAKR